MISGTNDIQMPSPAGADAAMLLAPAGVKSAAGAKDARQLEQVAKDFESLLLHKVLEEMRKTIPESGLLDDPISKQTEDIVWMQLAQDLANRGGLGLARELSRQMKAGPPLGRLYEQVKSWGAGQARPPGAEQVR